MIREAKASDAREILGIYAHYVENTAVSFEYDVPEVSEMERRIRDNKDKYEYLVLEKDGHIAGYAYGSRFRDRKAYERTVEVSVYVHKDELKRGYGSALMKELLKRLKEKGMKTAVAVVTSENEASSRAFMAMGFTYAGHLPQVGYKLGSWHGINQYFRIL
ncbi:N-acetyltransferase [Proteiniclasticum sp. SCR006]|uniref:N-acetyltransferase n=1 Tax=Proteiniclasticum aestuarii TaxID=2817862 RepID=A0A939HCV3_9CLOT|nr:GNAT family N-acetyltransferase [Proteiniclasticum aestuarii]MBO1266088.1 N-acetyltransferase [Proteiniclasticum aestuarii]